MCDIAVVTVDPLCAALDMYVRWWEFKDEQAQTLLCGVCSASLLPPHPPPTYFVPSSQPASAVRHSDGWTSTQLQSKKMQEDKV